MGFIRVADMYKEKYPEEYKEKFPQKKNEVVQVEPELEEAKVVPKKKAAPRKKKK